MTAHSKDREGLFSLVTEWLDGYRDSDGGYANITTEDIIELHSIARRLIELKCQSDCDGDYPLEIRLTNRTKCRSNRFRDVPYDYDSPDTEVLPVLLDNAQRANSQLSDFLRTCSINKLLKESE